MKEVREKAFLLRKKGRSYNEINRLLGIPKSTLSGWFSGMVLSEEAQERIKSRVHRGLLNGLVKRNKMQTHLARKRAKDTCTAASKEIGKISNRELLLIGTALYWGEGYKKLVIKDGIERTHHVVSLANSDPAMIKVFIKFLTEIISVSKQDINISMRIFKHINEESALKYWCNVTGLNKNNFYRTSYTISKSSQGKRPYNRLPYGTIQVTVCNTEKFHKIMGWIEGIQRSS